MEPTAPQRKELRPRTAQKAGLDQAVRTREQAPATTEPQATSFPTAHAVQAGQATIAESNVRLRAYELYLERGATPGNEVEDWLQAERELLADSGSESRTVRRQIGLLDPYSVGVR